MYDNVSRLILFKKGSSFIHIRRAHVWLISKLGLYGLASFWVKSIIWLSSTNYLLSSLSWLRDQLHIFVAKNVYSHVFASTAFFKWHHVPCLWSGHLRLERLLTLLTLVGVNTPARWRRFVPRFASTSQRLWPRSLPVERGGGLIWTKEEKGTPWTNGYLKRWGPRLLKKVLLKQYNSNISDRCFFGWSFFGRIGSVTILMYFCISLAKGKKTCINIWDNYWRMLGAGKDFCPMKSAAQKFDFKSQHCVYLLSLEFSNCTSWDGFFASKCIIVFTLSHTLSTNCRMLSIRIMIWHFYLCTEVLK